MKSPHFCFAAVCSLFASVPAIGQLAVTQTYDFHENGPFSVTSSFSGVDAGMGTLTDVAVATWLRVDVTFRVENLNAYEISDPWGSAYGPFTGMGADKQDWWFDYSYSADGPSPAQGLAAYDGSSDFGGESGYTWSTTTGDLELYTIHPDLGLYDWTNSPEIPFSLSLQFWHNLVGQGDMTYEYDIEVTGQQSLTYTYATEPTAPTSLSGPDVPLGSTTYATVPEPATYTALIAFGLFVVMLLRRYRQRKSGTPLSPA